MSTGPLGKILILTGVAIVVLGVVLLFIDKIPLLGKLPGDFVVRNLTTAAEEYIVPEKKFYQKYEWMEDGEHDYASYRSKGMIIALELTSALLSELGLPELFYFKAPWEEDMLAQKGDFIASHLGLNEVYRIGRKEFFETYQALH